MDRKIFKKTINKLRGTKMNMTNKNKTQKIWKINKNFKQINKISNILQKKIRINLKEMSKANKTKVKDKINTNMKNKANKVNKEKDNNNKQQTKME